MTIRLKDWLPKVVSIAREAGDAILEVYNGPDFGIELKDDNSPLTKADKAAHEIIQEGLQKINPEIPILSEEGKHTPYLERSEWDVFWLVDPLDGTKEFIKRNGEFTVNIALIQNKKPVLGVIQAPVKDMVYYGSTGRGAFKKHGLDEEEIKVNNKSEGLIAVQSRSHASDEDTTLSERYDIVDTISVGSSLKFCMVAEGKADIYYRAKPTMEWDTGAGQAIVEAAGGKVFIELSNNPFLYNKEELVNTGFLCLGF